MEKPGSQCHGGANLAWFVAGVGVGAAAAVLFTPRAGRQTRELISHKAQEGMDFSREAMERGKHLMDEANELFERGRRLTEAGEVIDPNENL